VLTVVSANGTLNALAVEDTVNATLVAFVAVPVVFWFSVGMSAAKIAFQPGAAPLVPFPVIVKNRLAVVTFGANRVVVFVFDW
jgi:hypothetical protein